MPNTLFDTEDPTKFGQMQQTPDFNQPLWDTGSAVAHPSMAQAGPSGIAPPPPSFFDKVKGFLGSARDRYADALTAGTPDSQFVTEADKARGRSAALLHAGMSMLSNTTGPDGFATSTLQRLAGGLGAGQQAYGNAVSGAENNHLRDMQINQQQDMLHARIQAGQAAIRQPGTTDEQYQTQLQNLFARQQALGDEKGAAATAELLKVTMKPRELQGHNIGGQTIFTDPITGQVKNTVQNTSHPMDPDTREALLARIEMMRQSGDVRGMMMAMREDSLNLRRDTAQLGATTRLNGQFRADVKPAQDGMQAVRIANTLYARALAGDPQAQKDYLMFTIKASQPNVSVKPGSMAAMVDGRPVTDAISMLYNKALKGTILTDKQLKSLDENNRATYDQHKARVDQVKKYYMGIAKRSPLTRDNADQMFNDQEDVEQVGGTPNATGNSTSYRSLVP